MTKQNKPLKLKGGVEILQNTSRRVEINLVRRGTRISLGTNESVFAPPGASCRKPRRVVAGCQSTRSRLLRATSAPRSAYTEGRGQLLEVGKDRPPGERAGDVMEGGGGGGGVALGMRSRPALPPGSRAGGISRGAADCKVRGLCGGAKGP